MDSFRWDYTLAMDFPVMLNSSATEADYALPEVERWLPSLLSINTRAMQFDQGHLLGHVYKIGWLILSPGIARVSAWKDVMNSCVCSNAMLHL